MQKQHSKPEFSIIKIEEDNRKFFVASGGEFTGVPSSTGEGTPTNSASQYDNGGDLNM